MRISVCGTGYLVAADAARMVELGYEVLGVDVDPVKLGAGEVPSWESGLEEVLQCNIAAGRLRFAASYHEAADLAEELHVQFHYKTRSVLALEEWNR